MNKVLLHSAYFTDRSTAVVSITNRDAVALAFKIKDEAGADMPLRSVEYVESEDKAATAAFKISLGCEIDVTKAYTAVCKPQADGVTASALPVKKFRLYDDEAFKKAYTYDGELGVHYTAKKSTFKVWSPVASDVRLNVYESGEAAAAQEYAMERGDKGVWSAVVNGDLNGKYYTYSVYVDGMLIEVVDPYARSACKNGARGMILKLKDTDPEGWDTQARPKAKGFTSTVIYEAHLRDLTIHESSNVSPENRGKYLGLTESGTIEKPTPLDYIKALGVTAVHFQPMYDFASVDESFSRATYNRAGEYNWGYDPQNYNVPEGSYSSDPADGFKRVNELKQMIMALHNAGLQVILDVVYNHVYDAGTSNFEALVPGYYFRMTGCGRHINGSGCGNETASDRPMFRKFMIDSVKYWAQEYKVDGFRFDIMGLHDVDTMNAIRAALSEIDPDIMIYGEGWTGGESGLAEAERAIMKNAKRMPGIAVFDDAIRDGLKGSVFDINDTGYASGKPSGAGVLIGAAGGTDALGEEIYAAIGKYSFAGSPDQNVNYVSCHDDATLWDKLNASVAAPESELKEMSRLAAAASLTGQGAGFFVAGEEFLRSKPTVKSNKYDNRPHTYKAVPDYCFCENSYRSPDSTNAIDWARAKSEAETVDFYKGLIAIKKTYPHFEIADRAAIGSCVTVKGYSNGLVEYAVKDPGGSSYMFVLMNNTGEAKRVSLPKAEYAVLVDGSRATADKDMPVAVFKGDMLSVSPRSAMVLYTEGLMPEDVATWKDAGGSAEGYVDYEPAIKAGIGIPSTVLIAGGTVFGAVKKPEA